ncbi:DUF1146 family protein [Salinicoccus kekensis]|uniref:Uncharacterized integral membrane protein (TIGR02327 family) n=1 Tax=Salinicoccus kekensis TaxID=714307 RepID=A0A285ULN4_9STAP|nr:DUF1146 family protein [Salinicoccus kekensis]SOC42673.1 uncharacterized integral membrane protein (TIGR02327 family) [Salinicoccus kekensis]
MIFSQLAFMHIILHILSVMFCFWLVQGLNIQRFFRKGESGKIILLMIVISVLLGSALSNFIMDFFTLVQQASLIFN